MPDYLVAVNVPLSQAEPDTVRRERIVRAKNEAQAIRHVVADTITIERVTIDDAMRLAAAGVKVEIAKAE